MLTKVPRWLTAYAWMTHVGVQFQYSVFQSVDGKVECRWTIPMDEVANA